MGASASSASAWPKPTEPAWAASLTEHWTPSEAEARERLTQLDLANYAEEPESAKFHSELLWRDFAWHRLYHLPNLATENVREKFDRFDWSWDDPRLKD